MDQMTLLRFEWRQARRRASQSRNHGDRAGYLIAAGQAEALYRQPSAGSTVANVSGAPASSTAAPTSRN
jgi:hypothetical protein